jgi:hypothetical protein
VQLSGEITYNGYTFDEFVVRRTAAYINQNDLHLPTVTVRETMDFAAMCMGEGFFPELLRQTKEKEKCGIACRPRPTIPKAASPKWNTSLFPRPSIVLSAGVSPGLVPHAKNGDVVVFGVCVLVMCVGWDIVRHSGRREPC